MIIQTHKEIKYHKQKANRTLFILYTMLSINLYKDQQKTI